MLLVPPAIAGAVEESDACGGAKGFCQVFIQKWHYSEFAAIRSRTGIQKSADGRVFGPNGHEAQDGNTVETNGTRYGRKNPPGNAKDIGIATA